jgi:hypothetical protein
LPVHPASSGYPRGAGTMSASATRSAQPVTRLACNRCHQQKLRCDRSLVPGQPCARCENAQVECIFEPPLRPGRPSTRRKSRSKPPSPSKGGTVASSVTSPRQQDDQSANDPPTGYLSELDGLFDGVASERPMAGRNDDQGMYPTRLTADRIVGWVLTAAEGHSLTLSVS